MTQRQMLTELYNGNGQGFAIANTSRYRLVVILLLLTFITLVPFGCTTAGCGSAYRNDKERVYAGLELRHIHDRSGLLHAIANQRSQNPCWLYIYADSSCIDDSVLCDLTLPQSVQEVSLAYTSIGDRGVNRLFGLRNLERLNISNTLFKGDSLVGDRLPSNLTELDVSNCPVEVSAWVDVIRELPQLRVLRMMELPSNKDLVDAISNLNGLVELDISFCRISDADISVLGQIQGLEILGLVATEITDHSVVSLLEMKRLRELDVSATRLSTAGLSKLVTHRRLITLIARNLQLTRREREEISNHAIDLHIIWE